MKKIFALWIVVTLIFTILVACTSKKDVALDYTFSEFLNAENFVPGLSQGDFKKQLGGYTYKKEKITDLVNGRHFDGANGGGYSASSKFLGFTNQYTVSSDERTASYYNYFRFHVPLDNLTLPYGIDFDDTLTRAIEKMGMDINLPDDFIGDDEVTASSTMTLYAEEGKSLVVQNHLLSPLDDPVYNYSLVYTETYKATRKDGRETNVTRFVKLHFGAKNVLSSVEIEVSEKFES